MCGLMSEARISWSQRWWFHSAVDVQVELRAAEFEATPVLLLSAADAF